MRLGVKATSAVSIDTTNRVNRAGDVEKTLRSQKEAATGSSRECYSQSLYEWIDGTNALRRGSTEIAIAAFTAEAIVNRDCFEERGLTRTVLSSKEHNGLPNLNLSKRSDCRHAERIHRPVANTLCQ